MASEQNNEKLYQAIREIISQEISSDHAAYEEDCLECKISNTKIYMIQPPPYSEEIIGFCAGESCQKRAFAQYLKYVQTHKSEEEVFGITSSIKLT